MAMAGKLLAVRKLRRLQTSRSERAIRYGICSLLLLSIAWVVWQTALLLRTPHQPLEFTSNTVEGSLMARDPGGDLADMHLFGAASREPEPFQADTNAVVTGIAYASDTGASRAILVIGGSQQSYSVGSVLPGGERVAEIEPEQVVLERRGERRGLRLVHPLADPNADFSYASSPLAARDVVHPEAGEASAAQGADALNAAVRLQALRRNLTAPPDPLAGKHVTGAAEVRAVHRERFAHKGD